MLSSLIPSLRKICINLETCPQLKRCISVASGNRFAKKELPFTFERKEKQLQIFNSGDTKELVPLDETRPILKYVGLEDELKNASPAVQKLVSLAFSRRGEEIKLHKYDIMKPIKRHIIDTSSFEARIAAITATVRCQQKYLLTVTLYNTEAKVSLKENIEARNKLLRKLRKQDYGRYLWVMETLGLTYKRAPMFAHWTTRKGTLRVMTREYCNKIRRDKIATFKAKLKGMQQEFLKEKEDTLEWIKREKEELGIKNEVNVKADKRQ